MAKAAGPDSFALIDGKKVGTVKGSLKIETGGMERTEIIADGVVHFTEGMVGSKISFRILVTPTTDIAAINNVTSGVIQAKLTTGKTGIQTSAFRSGKPVSLDMSNGEADVEFTGDPVTGL